MSTDICKWQSVKVSGANKPGFCVKQTDVLHAGDYFVKEQTLQLESFFTSLFLFPQPQLKQHKKIKRNLLTHYVKTSIKSLWEITI